MAPLVDVAAVALLGLGLGIAGRGAVFGTFFKPSRDGVREFFLAEGAGEGAGAEGNVDGVAPSGFAVALGSGLGRAAFFLGVVLASASARRLFTPPFSYFVSSACPSSPSSGRWSGSPVFAFFHGGPSGRTAFGATGAFGSGPGRGRIAMVTSKAFAGGSARLPGILNGGKSLRLGKFDSAVFDNPSDTRHLGSKGM